MCLYTLVKHSLCGCTTTELTESCSFAKRNGFQCAFRAPALLSYDDLYHDLAYAFDLLSEKVFELDAAAAKKKDGRAGEEDSPAERKAKEERLKRKWEKRCMLYPGREKRMTLDMCDFCRVACIESWNERVDQAWEAFGGFR